MDIVIISKIIILLILLILSAFFSSSETALTTVSRIKMKTLADEGDKKAARVLKVTANKSKMLSAILIGNNIVNLSASSLATTVAIKIWGNVGAGIATGVLTLLILIFGEIAPKTMATVRATNISRNIAGIIYGLMWILTPIIAVVNFLAHGVLIIMGINPKEQELAITEAELKTIMDVSHESGVIEKDEHEYINNVFDFSDACAKEIMIPRIDMTVLNVDCSYDEIIEDFRENRHTRYPVYEDDTDNIIGILNMKDIILLNDEEDFNLRDLLRTVNYTYEKKKCADLFEEMRKNSISLDIVLDEYGAVAGMVTLEDLLEELVGEIRDEFDTDEEDDLIKTGENEYDVRGSMNLEDLSRELNLNFISQDYDTIGGYLTGEFDHFPIAGETYITPEFHQLQVISVEKNRITKIHIKLAGESKN